MAYQLETRLKALAAYESGAGSQEKIAQLFQLGISTFKRWVKKTKHGESLEPPSTRSGRPKKITEKGVSTIKNLVKQNPAITLNELIECYGQKHNVKVSLSMMSRELKILNLRHKKLSLQSVEKESGSVKKKETRI